MSTLHPEKNKLPGVWYAVTEDGVELPIVDITHPAFAENATPEKMAALTADFLEFQSSPAFFRGFFSRHSIALRGINSEGDFLHGMTTYIAKLGPNVLGKAYASIVDRKVAGGIGSVSFRIRLRDTARLLAEALAPLLATKSGRPVQMLNVGGGPAMDSLNALILIQRDHSECLRGRRINIRVLDLDPTGPRFGARAVETWVSQGAPLHGLQLSLDSIAYDWAHPSELGKAMGKLDAADVSIGSSEGGLFEYGSDDLILANLRVLRDCTPADFAMVGSIIRNGDLARSLHATSKMPIRSFEPADFKTLVARAGWSVGRALEGSPLYQVVSLKKM